MDGWLCIHHLDEAEAIHGWNLPTKDVVNDGNFKCLICGTDAEVFTYCIPRVWPAGCYGYRLFRNDGHNVRLPVLVSIIWFSFNATGDRVKQMNLDVLRKEIDGYTIWRRIERLIGF